MRAVPQPTAARPLHDARRGAEEDTALGRLESLLWIGPAEGLAASGIALLPSLDVTWARDVDEALALPVHLFDAAVLEGEAPDAILDGLARLRRRPRAPALVVRAPACAAERVREFLGAGARDVMLVADAHDAEETGPQLLERLHAARSRGPDDGPVELEGVVACSAAMRAVFELVARAARSSASVLLTGETGTGKELIARALHGTGPRREQPFVAINCAAFPDTLLESELFGHARGAFTGADRDKKGLFEVAHGGTLFLDEIGETSGPLQAKLLRALQEREIRPLGSARARRVDVRVLSATNKELRAEASRGFFREDLYFRLAVFPIRVPPLRDRPEDVLPLAEHFLERHGRREGKRGCRLSRAASHMLLAHRWPGNVRELENEIQRSLALAEPGEIITPALLSDRVSGTLEPAGACVSDGEPLSSSLDRVEAWLIRRALERNGGRRAQTARELGITREGLYKKMQRLRIVDV
jgi:transcriptional regulator with PAS, ATPase and Fis domain